MIGPSSQDGRWMLYMQASSLIDQDLVIGWECEFERVVAGLATWQGEWGLYMPIWSS